MEISSGSNTIPLICLFVFVAFMVIATIFAIVYSAQRSKETRSFAAQLGFTILSKPEDALLTRLRELFKPSKVVRVTNLARKTEGYDQVYLLDVLISSQNPGRSTESSGNSEVRNVAIVSSNLNLPPFLLIYRMPTLGPLGNVLNDLITTGASMAGFKEWDLVPPDFSLTYLLYVKEDPRLESVFNSQTLSAIARTQKVVARGVDDLLLFNTYDVRRGSKMDAAELASHIQQARQLSRWLGG